MFLIEFQKDEFINGEIIDFVDLTNNRVTFTFTFSNGRLYTVDKELESAFLNHMQALNDNITNIQSRHLQINKPDTKY